MTRTKLPKATFRAFFTEPQSRVKGNVSEWSPSEQSKPDEIATQPAEEIASRIKAEFDKNKHLLTPELGSKDQHIVAFLGKTGEGKKHLGLSRQQAPEIYSA